ncbi:hypothetical protein [Methylorubrum thiocyanatum]
MATTAIDGLRHGGGEWTGRSPYDATSGHTYDAGVGMQGGERHLRGYLSVSALGQNRVFLRTP